MFTMDTLTTRTSRPVRRTFLFNPGKPMMTSGINKAIQRNPEFLEFLRRCMRRFLNGDWGDVTDQDNMRNNQALLDGKEAILGAYDIPRWASRKPGTVWILREWDGSMTTVMFPYEY